MGKMSPILSYAVLLLCLCMSGQLALGDRKTARLSTPAQSTCLPEMPPGSKPPDSSAPAELLQMHNLVWIENITNPSWAPTTKYSQFSYDFLKQGLIVNQSVPLLTLFNSISVPISILTNGETLCMSVLTLHREDNENGTSESFVCNRACFTNFTSQGRPMNLLLMVLNDQSLLKRSSEYLVVDSLDPSERDSFNCLGLFTDRYLSELPRLRHSSRQCPAGDMCLFNYDGTVIDAGCKSSFRFNWCVGNTSLCDYTSGRDCPICCRGDNCNLAVADEIYRVWGAAADCRASSLMTILAAAALGLVWLRSGRL